MKNVKNMVLKPKPLKLRKAVLDRPGYARSRSVHSHRHEFLLTDEEEEVFQAIVDGYTKHYQYPKGSARAETFRCFLQFCDVKKVLREREQILSFGAVLHEKDADIEKLNSKMVVLEIKADELSEELILCQAELMILGKMELNQETVEYAKQISEERKLPNAAELKRERERLRAISILEKQDELVKLVESVEPTEPQSLCRFCGSPWTPSEGIDPVAGFCDGCSGERENLRRVMYGRS
jgi:hypothetical protein